MAGSNYPSMPYFPQTFDAQLNGGQQPQTQYQNVHEQPQVQQQPQPPRIQIDDENENRDWLEIFYTFSRLVVLLSLVYFYSSPLRCSIVLFVITLYYL